MLAAAHPSSPISYFPAYHSSSHTLSFSLHPPVSSTGRLSQQLFTLLAQSQPSEEKSLPSEAFPIKNWPLLITLTMSCLFPIEHLSQFAFTYFCSCLLIHGLIHFVENKLQKVRALPILVIAAFSVP